MRNTIRFGLLTAAGLIAYFLFMKLIGQETNFALRFFNFFIIIGGTFLLFKRLFVDSEHRVSYFNGLISGVLMNVVAVATFLVFMAGYTTFLDPQFLGVLESSKIWGSHLGLLEASFAIMIEGIASGVVISFSWMQYFKSYTLDNSVA